MQTVCISCLQSTSLVILSEKCPLYRRHHVLLHRKRRKGLEENSWKWSSHNAPNLLRRCSKVNDVDVYWQYSTSADDNPKPHPCVARNPGVKQCPGPNDNVWADEGLEKITFICCGGCREALSC
uniref:Secreted protein n=1 Tax=Steinernema glaseri TaxID=37863 RepID=A0A1I7YHK2_9BILA